MYLLYSNESTEEEKGFSTFDNESARQAWLNAIISYSWYMYIE